MLLLTTDIIYTPAAPDDPASAPGGTTWADEAVTLFSHVLIRQFGAPGSVRVLWTSQGRYMPGVCAGTLAVNGTGDDGDDAIINIAVYGRSGTEQGQTAPGRVIRMLTPVIF
jgi:hypothetical protein